jgi:hypothetical protein
MIARARLGINVSAAKNPPVGADQPQEIILGQAEPNQWHLVLFASLSQAVRVMRMQ